MKTIIAGSRTINDMGLLEQVIKDSGFHISEVVCGGARGVDSLGKKWAEEYGKYCALFLAQWDKFGKRAGYIRNAQMADYADAVIILWDGRSKGTKHMIEQAEKKKLKYYVHIEQGV